MSKSAWDPSWRKGSSPFTSVLKEVIKEFILSYYSLEVKKREIFMLNTSMKLMNLYTLKNTTGNHFGQQLYLFVQLSQIS